MLEWYFKNNVVSNFPPRELEINLNVDADNGIIRIHTTSSILLSSKLNKIIFYVTDRFKNIVIYKIKMDLFISIDEELNLPATLMMLECKEILKDCYFYKSTKTEIKLPIECEILNTVNLSYVKDGTYYQNIVIC